MAGRIAKVTSPHTTCVANPTKDSAARESNVTIVSTSVGKLSSESKSNKAAGFGGRSKEIVRWSEQKSQGMITSIRVIRELSRYVNKVVD